MQEDANGFMYPAIDADKCIECRQCIKVCHNNKVLNKGEASFYMGWHKDLEVLRRSSSGGAFTALADIVLERGGVVFGASFNEKTRCVEHVAIERKDQLDLLRLSKYYQGSIGNCYDQAKEALKTRWVLFSGTSCQIAGLYAYLDRDYDNLITVEILCHGITSKHVVDEYIKSKEKKYKKKIRTFRFRIKPEDGDWVMGGGTKMRLDFEDGTYVIENKGEDTFFYGFNQYLFLRDSCYHCKYTGEERVADFTIADFWGVDLKKIPDLQRRYGVSLILFNSDKANKLMENLERDMYLEAINPEEAIPYNQALVMPSSLNENRTCFFKKLGKKSFDSLIFRFNWKFYTKIRSKKRAMQFLGEKNYYRLKNIKNFLKKLIRPF